MFLFSSLLFPSVPSPPLLSSPLSPRTATVCVSLGRSCSISLSLFLSVCVASVQTRAPSITHSLTHSLTLSLSLSFSFFPYRNARQLPMIDSPRFHDRDDASLSLSGEQLLEKNIPLVLSLSLSLECTSTCLHRYATLSRSLCPSFALLRVPALDRQLSLTHSLSLSLSGVLRSFYRQQTTS